MRKIQKQNGRSVSTPEENHIERVEIAQVRLLFTGGTCTPKWRVVTVIPKSS